MTTSNFDHLDQNARQFVENVEQAVSDTKQAMHTLGESIVGAEFLAAKELTEDLGIQAEFTGRLETIARQQWQMLQEDVANLAAESQSVRQPEQFTTVVLKHFARRHLHRSQGALEVIQAFQAEQLKMMETHQTLGQTFIKLLSTPGSIPAANSH